MNNLAEILSCSPELYPYALNQFDGAIQFIRLSREDYAAASFLDQRIISPKTTGTWLPWTQVEASARNIGRDDCGYIFHIGHVGSTLLSRMLGEHPALFSLREPLPLRVLALLRLELDTAESHWSSEQFTTLVEMLVRLWSRTYHEEQRTVVKATSFASEVAPELLSHASSPPAIFMYAQAETYIAGILGGEASRQELRAMAQQRLRRLHARIGTSAWRLWDLSEGERAAASWACEMAALLAAAAGTRGGQIMWIDFERFLQDPAQGLRTAAAQLGTDYSQDRLDKVIGGPLLRQYSKAPEHSYSPSLRRQVLDQARRDHRYELARAMKWLENAASRFPIIAAALDHRSFDGMQVR